MAESIVFPNSDGRLSDEALIAEVRISQLVDMNSEVTIKRSGNGFTFVNFNFISGS
jgi:hypothetical protein